MFLNVITQYFIVSAPKFFEVSAAAHESTDGFVQIFWETLKYCCRKANTCRSFDNIGPIRKLYGICPWIVQKKCQEFFVKFTKNLASWRGSIRNWWRVDSLCYNGGNSLNIGSSIWKLFWPIQSLFSYDYYSQAVIIYKFVLDFTGIHHQLRSKTFLENLDFKAKFISKKLIIPT